MAIHGVMPAMHPSQNGSSPPPGCSYFSCSRPNRIMETLTPNSATSAAMSLIPVIMAMSTIMMEELSAYSIQRA